MNAPSTELIISMLQEQAKAQAEQSKAQAEQAKAQEIFQSTVLLEFGIVKQQLEKIESDVLIIKGAVLSDFAGISESTKKEIETEAELALEEKEVIVGTKEFFDNTHPAFRTDAFKKVRKTVTANSLGSVVYSYDPCYSKKQLSSVGQWVNAQLSKIFGETLKGKYDHKVMPLVSVLVGYYLAERVSNGRAF